MAGVAAMQFYARSTDVSAEMEEMNAEGKKVTAAGSEGDTGPTTVKKLFTDPDLRKPLFIACALAVIQQFSGINAVCRTRRSCYCCSDRSHFHSVLRMRTTVKFYELKSS